MSHVVLLLQVYNIALCMSIACISIFIVIFNVLMLTITSKGAITGCNLNDSVAFGGYFIVRKDWRRRGVGKLLFDKHLKHIGDRNFGIDAVEDRVEHDKKDGFIHMSFPVSAYMGIPDRANLATLDDEHAGSLVKFNPDLFEQLFVYDTKMHTIPRREFLKCWIKEDITTTYCAVAEGGIEGYGCVQPIEGGSYMIGPVFADTPELAGGLFTKLMLSVPEGKQVAFDIPSENPLSQAIVKRHKMVFELKLYRMYTKEVLKFDLEKVYAFTTMGIALV